MSLQRHFAINIKIRCGYCGLTEVMLNTTPAKAENYFLELGWRETINYSALAQATCPDCFAMRPEDRLVNSLERGEQ